MQTSDLSEAEPLPNLWRADVQRPAWKRQLSSAERPGQRQQNRIHCCDIWHNVNAEVAHHNMPSFRAGFQHAIVQGHQRGSIASLNMGPLDEQGLFGSSR